MRITDIRCTTVAVPTAREYKSTWRRAYHGSVPVIAVLVEVETDEGITGIGEAPAAIGKDAAVTEEIMRAVKFLLIGQDPLNVERLKREMYAHLGLPHFGVRGLAWALSGIDIALWDLVGKAAGLPLAVLWGGPLRRRIPFYADVPPEEPDRMAEVAREWVARGFRTLYMKVGFDPALDLARVRAVREAVGFGLIRIRVDANQAWSPGMAKTMIRQLSECDQAPSS